jgi:hypothetical protein
VDQSASDPAATTSFHDRDLVQEEFASLVRVDDFDGGREPCRSIVNVAKNQVMAVVGEEPLRLLGDYLVVEGVFEPSDLNLVCSAHSLNPNFGVRCHAEEASEPAGSLKWLVPMGYTSTHPRATDEDHRFGHGDTSRAIVGLHNTPCLP